MVWVLAVHRPLKAEYFLERMIFTWLNTHVYVDQVFFFFILFKILCDCDPLRPLKCSTNLTGNGHVVSCRAQFINVMCQISTIRYQQPLTGSQGF